MASEQLMKRLVQEAFQDTEIQILFNHLMDKCREDDEAESRDMVLDQIAGSVGSFMLNKHVVNVAKTSIMSDECHDNNSTSIDDKEDNDDEHNEQLTQINTNISNNTHSGSHDVARPTECQVEGSTDVFSDDLNSDDAPTDIISHTDQKGFENDQDNLCSKIISNFFRASVQTTSELNPKMVISGNTDNYDMSDGEELKTVWMRLSSSALKEMEDEDKLEDCLAPSARTSRVSDKGRNESLEDKSTIQEVDIRCRTVEDDESNSKEKGEESNEEDFQSVTDHIEIEVEQEYIMDLVQLDDQFLEDNDVYHSASDNDDLETCVSSDNMDLIQCPPLDFLKATDNMAKITEDENTRIKHTKIIRPQFCGTLYLKRIEHAKLTATEVAARKPEPRIKLDKPCRLDTDLMYAVRHSLKRSLPIVAGGNKLSALMVMAEGMYDEMSLDRDLDDLTWPFDPLAELRESGLAKIDYMDTISSIVDRKDVVEIPTRPKTNSILAKSDATVSMADTINTQTLTDERSSKHLSSPITSADTTRGLIRKWFNNVFPLPSIPVQIPPTVDIAKSIDITISNVHNTVDMPVIYNTNDIYANTDVDVDEAACLKENIGTSQQPDEGSFSGVTVKSIRPQFLGTHYLTNLANAHQTAREIKMRKPEPRVQIEKPCRLDTDLMYAVHQSLKRSLPMVAGNNKLSALMMMADGMFDEMPLDRDLDDLTWSCDPLAELRQSGLAMVDYMDSLKHEVGPSSTSDKSSRSIEIVDKDFVESVASTSSGCIITPDDETVANDDISATSSSESLESEYHLASDKLHGPELLQDDAQVEDVQPSDINDQPTSDEGDALTIAANHLNDAFMSRILLSNTAVPSKYDDDDDSSNDSALGEEYSTTTLLDEETDAFEQDLHQKISFFSNTSTPTSQLEESLVDIITDQTISSKVRMFEQLATEQRFGTIHRPRDEENLQSTKIFVQDSNDSGVDIKSRIQFFETGECDTTFTNYVM